MELKKELAGTALTVSLSGRLDTTSAPQLEAALAESYSNIDALTLDFAALDYISSAGLRVLLSAQKTMNKQGSMKIINVCPEIMDIFEITGFKDILTIG